MEQVMSSRRAALEGLSRLLDATAPEELFTGPEHDAIFLYDLLVDAARARASSYYWEICRTARRHSRVRRGSRGGAARHHRGAPPDGPLPHPRRTGALLRRHDPPAVARPREAPPPGHGRGQRALPAREGGVRDPARPGAADGVRALLAPGARTVRAGGAAGRCAAPRGGRGGGPRSASAGAGRDAVRSAG